MDGSGKEKPACAATKHPEGDWVSLARALQAALAAAPLANAAGGSGVASEAAAVVRQALEAMLPKPEPAQEPAGKIVAQATSAYQKAVRDSKQAKRKVEEASSRLERLRAQVAEAADKYESAQEELQQASAAEQVAFQELAAARDADTAAAAATAEENGEGEAAMELDDDVDDEALDKLEQDEDKEVAAEASATKKLREKHKKLAKEMAELRKQANAATGRLSVRKPGLKAKVEVVKQATSVAIGARPETLVGAARPSNHPQNG